MVEMKNFVFCGEPIKIKTQKWCMEFTSSLGCNTSTIEITKDHCWGRRYWTFRIVKNDDKLISYSEIGSIYDPIGKCIRHLEELSEKGELNWSAIDTAFSSMIPYLNE